MNQAVHHPPPAAPGALGVAVASGELLAYLGKVTSWRDWLVATLDDLDRRAKVAVAADDLTADMTLAYALYQSITTRLDEILATWDSGRVGEPERERISQLVWGRLGGGVDAVVAVSFAEACTLADALVDRLRDRLDADALGVAGVGDTAEAVRASIVRSRAIDGGRARAGELRAIEQSVQAAVSDATNGVDVRDRMSRYLREASTIERDLLLERAALGANARDLAELTARLAAAEQRATAARDLAVRCAEKIAHAPRLAIPAPSALGAVPSASADWRADRVAIDTYDARLDQVEAALAEVEERFGAPLERRTELRGLLDAYRAMALRRGVGEHPDVTAAYAAARSVLYTAPLDLAEGLVAVTGFDQAVRAAQAQPTPADPSPETTDAPDPARGAKDA